MQHLVQRPGDIDAQQKHDRHEEQDRGAGPEAIANRVYANRLGNGDEASGDGWRYRGSGYLQLTGRTNFRTQGSIVKMDLEGHPELVREPATAAQAGKFELYKTSHHFDGTVANPQWLG